MIHGTTTTGYRTHGCRCPDCTAASVRATKQWRHRTGADTRTGVPEIPDLVDIAPVREHYQQLRATGWTVADVASEVGVTVAHLSWAMGSGNTRPRIRRERAAAILALEPLAPVDVDPVVVERLVATPVDGYWRTIGATRPERIAAAELLPSKSDAERRFGLRQGRDFAVAAAS